MFSFKKYLKPYTKQFILGPAAKLLEAVFELMLPLLMAQLIDVGVKNKDAEYIWKISFAMLLVSVIGFAAALFCQYAASVASQGFGTDLRNGMMEKINSFSHKEVDKFGASSLVNRSTVDVNQLQFAVAMVIRLVVRAPFLCIGGMIMAARIDLQLALILIFFIPVFILILGIIMKKTIPLYRAVQRKLDTLSVVLRENLTGVRVVRAFANAEMEKNKFNRANKSWMETSIGAGKIAALLSPLTLLIMNVATLAIIWFGGIRVNVGGLTQGQLIAFISYITQIMLALIVVSNLTIIFTKAAASAIRVKEIMNTESSVVNQGIKEKTSEKAEAIVGVASLKDVPISVEFKQVSFAYGEGQEYALKNISFRLSAGQTMGIIGGTGSGKSSLLHLISRFYDVDSGEIRINTIDIKQYPLFHLRAAIGLVPQKVSLFSGTIRSNLTMGKIDATDIELKEAADIAQAREFIEALPLQYDAVVAQGGKNFSGGQKQRLSIARALVRKPQLLILDDSSSALDYATDNALRKQIKERCLGTTIIASQRVNAIMHTDFILVLHEGEMVGIGTHQALLASNTLYQEICQSQKIMGGEVL